MGQTPDDTRGVIYNCPEFAHCGGWKKQGSCFFNSKTYFEPFFILKHHNQFKTKNLSGVKYVFLSVFKVKHLILTSFII
jgi:hypothetical protein